MKRRYNYCKQEIKTWDRNDRKLNEKETQRDMRRQEMKYGEEQEDPK